MERHPKLLGAVALVVITVLALPTLGLRLGTSDQGNDPKGSTTRQAYDLLAEGFGPGVNGPSPWSPRWAGPRTGSPWTTSTPPAHHRGRLLGDTGDVQLRRRDRVPRRRARVGPAVPTTSDLVERLRSEVLPRAEAGTALDVHVGGVAAGYDDFADVIVG